MAKKQNEAQPDIDGAFLKTLQTHQKGKTISDISAALRRVTEAVALVTKPGKVVITLNISPAAAGQDSAFGFSVDVVEKAPKAPAFAGLFFADDHNNLVRENNRQQEIPQMRVIAGGAPEEKSQLRRIEEA